MTPMREVAFHFNVPDRLGYACRLLRKAAAGGAQVAVTAPPEVLRQLDTLLWTFSQTDFVPHALATAEAAVRAASPILLCTAAQEAPHRQVLLNLGDDVPSGYEEFERLIEIVSAQGEDRQNARARWKHYTELGLPLTRHDQAAKEGGA